MCFNGNIFNNDIKNNIVSIRDLSLQYLSNGGQNNNEEKVISIVNTGRVNSCKVKLL